MEEGSEEEMTTQSLAFVQSDAMVFDTEAVLRSIEGSYQGILSFDLTPLEAIVRTLTKRARDGENA